MLDLPWISFKGEMRGNDLVEVNKGTSDDVVPDSRWDIQEIWLRGDLCLDKLDILEIIVFELKHELKLSVKLG